MFPVTAAASKVKGKILFKAITDCCTTRQYQPMQHFVFAPRSDTFKDVKYESRFIFSFFIFSETVHLVTTCHCPRLRAAQLNSEREGCMLHLSGTSSNVPEV